VKDSVFFFQIVDKVLDYYPEANTRILEKAYVFAARTLSSLFKHRHAQSLNGNRYGFLTHNLSVASILSELKLDEETIAAGILHDVGEKLSSEANISSLLSPYFSEDIARIVDGVTRLNKLSYSQKKTSKDKEEKDDRAEYFRKMLLAISRDVRVIFVKLADRLDEIRRVVAELDESSADKDPRTLSMIDLARETLDVYAPLAARLGIEWIKKDLENLAFRILDP
jgi:GTP pyrophosphokinase